MRKIGIFLGCAFTALLPIAGAQAQGQLFIAIMNGDNVIPPTASPFTGTVFAVLDKPESGVTYWFTHNITNVTGGEIRRTQPGIPGGSVKHVFTNPASPGGPYKTVVLSPALDSPLMRNGGIYAQFQTAANPNGVIGGVFVPYLFPVSTTSRVQGRVASVLNQSAGQGDDMNQVLVNVAQTSAATQAVIFDELAGRTLFAQTIGTLDNFASLQDTLFTHAGENGPGAGYFNGFIKGGISFGKRDASIDQLGSKVSRPYAVAGVNYGLMENVFAGIAVGFADSADKFDASRGKTDVTTTAGFAYISSKAGWAELLAVAGYGVSDIETTRSLASISRTALASPRGNGWSIGAKITLPYHISDTATVGPYLSISTRGATVKAYTENNAGDAGLIVPQHKDKDSAVEFGAAFRGPLTTGLTLRMEAGAQQYFGGGNKPIQASFIASPVEFASNVDGRSPTAGRVGLSLATDMGNNLSAEAGYRGYISGRMSVHMIEVRLTLRIGDYID